MRVIIAVALSLIIAGPSFAQDWVSYTSKTDFFAVNFPGQPRVQDISYKTEYNLTLPGHVYSAANGPSRYSVTVVDYSNAEKLISDRVKACQAELGDVDACTPQFQSRREMRGAIVYATWQLLQRDAKLTHFTYAYADLVEGHQLQLTNKDGSRTFAAIYMHENRPGSFRSEETIFATYNNAGVRVFDIRDAFAPKEIGYWVPPAPNKLIDPRPNETLAAKSADVYVTTEGLMYVTDWNGGLNVLQFEG